MNSKSRITSILKASSLESSITRWGSFDLSQLDLPSDTDFQLPTNLRLGHLAEKVVSRLIKLSSNYIILHENIQIIENGKTLGEIDFILQDLSSHQVIHMELAYKFYLLDPSISDHLINNWIGPNRKDSLIEKLDKLNRKQFPMLNQVISKSKFENLKIDETSQALCLLASLYVPYNSTIKLDPNYQKHIRGHYININSFIDSDKTNKAFYIPPKTDWGINPSENKNWSGFTSIEPIINKSMEEKHALLCWEKNEDVYSEFFIVWW